MASSSSSEAERQEIIRTWAQRGEEADDRLIYVFYQLLAAYQDCMEGLHHATVEVNLLSPLAEHLAEEVKVYRQALQLDMFRE